MSTVADVRRFALYDTPNKMKIISYSNLPVRFMQASGWAPIELNGTMVDAALSEDENTLIYFDYPHLYIESNLDTGDLIPVVDKAVKVAGDCCELVKLEIGIGTNFDEDEEDEAGVNGHTAIDFNL